MWRAMKDGPQAMAAELEQVGKKGKKAASEMESEFGKMAGHWTTIAGAIGMAKEAIDTVIEAQREFRRLTKDATVPVDTMSRAYAIQGGLSNADMATSRRQILAIAQARSTTPQIAFPAATQLVSSGFAPQNVTQGGALNEFLKMLSANNATGQNVDSKQMAQSLTMFLQATGQPLTAQSIRKNAMQIQSLFMGTNLQIADLQTFAPQATKSNQLGGLTSEQLVLFSQMRDVSDAAIGATALRSALSNLAVAGSKPKTKLALKQLGLRAEDVSFRGPGSPLENYYRVAENLVGAFERADPMVGDQAAARLFGQEGLAAKGPLFTRKGLAETRRRMQMGGDAQLYERAVGLAEGSHEGKARAAESGEAAAFFNPAFVDSVTVRKLLREEKQLAGANRFEQYLTEKQYDLFMMLPGATAETALRSMPGYRQNEHAVQEILNRAKAETPADVRVRVELTDQSAVAIPHRPEVSKLNKGKK